MFPKTVPVPRQYDMRLVICDKKQLHWAHLLRFARIYCDRDRTTNQSQSSVWRRHLSITAHTQAATRPPSAHAVGCQSSSVGGGRRPEKAMAEPQPPVTGSYSRLSWSLHIHTFKTNISPQTNIWTHLIMFSHCLPSSYSDCDLVPLPVSSFLDGVL